MSPSPDSPTCAHEKAIDIKSAYIGGLGLVLRSTDQQLLGQALSERFDGSEAANVPVLVDVSRLDAGELSKLDLGKLLTLLKHHALQPVGIVGAQGELLEAALALGLSQETDLGHRPRRSQDEGGAAAIAETLPAGGTPAAPGPSTEQIEAEQLAALDQAVRQATSGMVEPPMVLEGPLRSGKRIYARNADVIVIGAVNHGAEVIADGNVHIYGPLRGRAVAGVSGNVGAKIFAAVMEPDLYAIAGIYSTTEKPLPTEVHGKAAMVRLEGEKLIVEPQPR